MPESFYDPNTPRWLMLLEATRLVHRRRRDTLCAALSSILSRDEAGNEAWRDARHYLLLMLPDRFETDWGWWRSREARVIGGCLAAAIAKDDAE